MNCNKLTKQDEHLIELFSKLNVSLADALTEQLNNATVTRFHAVSSYFLDFDVRNANRKVHTSHRVPIEIIYGVEEVPVDQIIDLVDGIPMIRPCTLKVWDNDAIGIRLHFQNGFIHELEVYNLAGKKIALDQISKNYVYIIFDSDILKT